MKLVFPVEKLAGEPTEGALLDLSGKVSTVVFKAINASGVVASASFAYSQHAGTLSGIPVGSQYRIEIEGRDAGGNARYHCAKAAVRVE